MKVKFGQGKTEYGPGVEIDLTGAEVATAIMAYLVARNCYMFGPATIRVNGELIENGSIYVDPSGKVIDKKGIGWSGKGENF